MTHRVVEQRSARRAHNPEVAGSSPAHASISMPARSIFVHFRSSNHWRDVAGSSTSLSVRTARFSPSRVSPGTAFLFAPAPAGLSRDSSSFSTTQAVWAPGADKAPGFFS